MTLNSPTEEQPALLKHVNKPAVHRSQQKNEEKKEKKKERKKERKKFLRRQVCFSS
jgi:hypothetical protein